MLQLICNAEVKSCTCLVDSSKYNILSRSVCNDGLPRLLAEMGKGGFSFFMVGALVTTYPGISNISH